MTVELVSGWVDGDRVVIVERAGDDVRARSLPAKWSLFVEDLDDDDRRDLQRMRDIVGVRVDGRYTRADFRNRWARKDFVDKVEKSNRGRSAAGVAPYRVLEADVNPLRRLLSDSTDLV